MFWFAPTLLLCLVAQSVAYIAQVRIYVDKAGVTKWKKLLGKSTHDELKVATEVLFWEMNLLLKGLNAKYNVDVQLQLEKVVLLDENILNTNAQGQIFQGQAPYDFDRWAEDKFKEGTFDLTMLFTGMDLTGMSSGYIALGASLPGVCTTAGVGVIEVLNKDLMAMLTVHEIAHVLGAKHDEDCGPGWYEKGNIMNTKTYAKSPNRWTFSQCTAVGISDKIQKLEFEGKNCLNDGKLAAQPILTNKTADEVCRILHGTQWAMSRGSYDNNYGAKFCTQLTCMAKLNKKFEFKIQKTPEGMLCGQNKKCVNSQCVSTQNGDARMSDLCPWGDQSLKLWGNSQSCSKAHHCEGTWRKWCCATCADDDVVVG